MTTQRSKTQPRKVSALAAHNCIKPGSTPIEVHVVTESFPGITLLAPKAPGYFSRYRCPACHKALMEAIVGKKCDNSECDGRIVAVRYQYIFEDRERSAK